LTELQEEVRKRKWLWEFLRVSVHIDNRLHNLRTAKVRPLFPEWIPFCEQHPLEELLVWYFREHGIHIKTPVRESQFKGETPLSVPR
jgi:hypothetical protein